MEKKHQQRLQQAFGDVLRNRKIMVLFIPDNYCYMDPELVELLKDAVNALLPPSPTPPIVADPAARRHADENYND
ncbi:hypothetical protein AAE02nite_42620 [Adhaeribacter aerolatus]|uniref:Uncharacterized protein n=1 Tax=Adhaeribacter aerolatus TaxID=670289 RepID=A0A512B3R5_9BACT|nr:hypothetical protein [Adhaeribacter aerolatus]GEO06598.1 hypothetical protein AAE02nite_42620 [Adhaeribacter aerolatus]